uniref:Glutathione synthetase n=1 Tax=Fundidesulfovibrio putealis TaxID=270496 RepID=A0A7C4AHI7_9BACT
MNDWFNEAVGIVAGTLTTTAYLPQVLQTLRTRSVEDISLRMYLLLCAGIALWLIYGWLIDSVSVMLANGISLALTTAILALKVAYGSRKNP